MPFNEYGGKGDQFNIQFINIDHDYPRGMIVSAAVVKSWIAVVVCGWLFRGCVLQGMQADRDTIAM